MTQVPTATMSDIVKPSEESATAALAALVGKPLARELWTLVVTELNLTQPVTDPANLRKIAERLMAVGEAGRAAGRGLRVQTITYQALAGS